MSIIGGVILIIALIGAGAFFMMSKSQNSTADTMKPVDGIESTQSTSKASIKSLLGEGKNVACTITYPDAKGSGKVYVADAKMRGDFSFPSGGGEMKTSMIQDGEYMYSWSGAQGTKMNISQVATAFPTTDTPTTQTDLDVAVDMDCDNWSVDATMFVVPADVRFTDMSAMMEQMQKQSTEMKKTQSGACDDIADAQAKAACMSATGQ